MTGYADALYAAGMSAPAAQGKELLFNQLQSAAEQLRLFSQPHAFYVPGRIEVLGKHTDYAGGRSLLACVERGFCALAFVRHDHSVRLFDVKSNSTAEFNFDSLISIPEIHWSTYPETVIRRLRRNFPDLQKGVDLFFYSDLPRAAGLSSSSAMLILSFFALSAANHLDAGEAFQHNLQTQEDLATYLACIENGNSFRELTGDRGVGTFGGSEDHTAILCCEPQHISQFAFSPTRFERNVKLPAELTFVIATSGVSAEKTGNAQQSYNQLAFEVSSILEIWNRASGRSDSTIGAALESSSGAADELRDLLRSYSCQNADADALISRFEQFFAEAYVIVPAAMDALCRGDVVQFGKFVDRSQQLAEDVLHNQVQETAFLAHAARELGAVAASAFGAGFGGSVWALINRTQSEQFSADWSREYREEFPQNSDRSVFFSTDPGPSVQRIR